MADIITRFRDWRKGFSLNLPVEPDTISALSVVVSLFVLLNPVLIITVVLLLDLLDGLVARRKNRERERESGELTDWACDRYSEFIIFGFFAIERPVFLLLPVLNVILTLAVLRKKRGAVILPLRQALLAYLLAKPYIALGTL